MQRSQPKVTFPDPLQSFPRRCNVTCPVATFPGSMQASLARCNLPGPMQCSPTQCKVPCEMEGYNAIQQFPGLQEGQRPVAPAKCVPGRPISVTTYRFLKGWHQSTSGSVQWPGSNRAACSPVVKLRRIGRLARITLCRRRFVSRFIDNLRRWRPPGPRTPPFRPRRGRLAAEGRRWTTLSLSSWPRRGHGT